MATIIDGTTNSSIAGDTTITGNLTVTGTATIGGIPAGGNYILSQYVAPGTWDATTKKAAGLKAIKVTVVGAGGSCASLTPGLSNSYSIGAGGGGGAAIEYVPASNITPGTKTVTAGPGTNSFGPWGTATPNSPTATTSATAGASGVAGPATTTSGGAGGVGSGGTTNIAGQAGGAASSSFTLNGNGGSSILGGGGLGVALSNATAGGNYGGGASGISRPSGTVIYTGASGAPGVVIIEEFY